MDEKNHTGKRKTHEASQEYVIKGYTDIPLTIFKDRNVAVLESLVEYMKDIQKLSYHEIALMLNRNDRTVWTVYRRAKLKRKGLIKHNSGNDE